MIVPLARDDFRFGTEAARRPCRKVAGLSESGWLVGDGGERNMLIPMDDIDRYALDIEKIATGAGSAAERSGAVDMVIDDLMTDLALANGGVRLHGAPASRMEYLLALRKKLDKLRATVDATARPAIDQAVARLQ
jgi:hypothetical protein